MGGTWTSLIAVAGTLLGGVITHVFQSRTAKRTEQFVRERQLRDERMAAYSTFAGALVSYRRGQYNRAHCWFDEPESPAYEEARAESYRLRSAAHQELFRVRLVADDPELTRLAVRAMELAEVIHDAAERSEIRQRGDRAKEALDTFIQAAGSKLRA
jgi:hypothetical protein